MNKPIIIDSSGFISLASITDSNFQKATSFSQSIMEKDKTVIMPGEVFTEIVNVVGKKIGHDAAIKQAGVILASETIILAETTSEIRSNALAKFTKQPKTVSFTDCLVMAVADIFTTKEIFGFDKVFIKNGYLIPH